MSPSSLVAQKSRVVTALRHAPRPRPVAVARRTLAAVSSTNGGESRRVAMIGGLSAAVVVLAPTGDAIAAGRAPEPPCEYKTAVRISHLPCISVPPVAVEALRACPHHDPNHTNTPVLWGVLLNECGSRPLSASLSRRAACSTATCARALGRSPSRAKPSSAYHLFS